MAPRGRPSPTAKTMNCILTDKAAVFSGESRQGKVLWESELERLGVKFIHATPYHPQTCGKVERFHQSVKRYLARQPKARTLAQLQAQLDRFRAYYNERRPHRALASRMPLVVFDVPLKARPLAGRSRHYSSACAWTRSTTPAA